VRDAAVLFELLPCAVAPLPDDDDTLGVLGLDLVESFAGAEVDPLGCPDAADAAPEVEPPPLGVLPDPEPDAAVAGLAPELDPLDVDGVLPDPEPELQFGRVVLGVPRVTSADDPFEIVNERLVLL
jgi:hypothetical protein